MMRFTCLSLVKDKFMQLNNQFLTELADDLEPIVKDVAEASMLAFIEHVSRGIRSGTWWPGQPARSAAIGEYIQEQLGKYKAGIQVVETNDRLKKLVGVFGVEYALYLELGTINMPAFEPVYLNMIDPETIAREIEALMRYDN